MSDTIDYDAAIKLVNDRRNENEQPSEPTKLNTAEPSADPEQELDTDEEVDESLPIEAGVETDEEGDEVEGDDLPLIEAPEFWDSDFKEKFSNLPREAQELMSEQAKHGSAAIAKKLNEVAEVRKSVEAKNTALNQHLEALNQVLPLAYEKISKYQKVNWEEAFEQQPEAAAQHFKVYKQEMAELNAIQQASQIAQVQALNAFVEAEESKLVEKAVTDISARKLTDPQTGMSTRKDVFAYVTTHGIAKEAAERASAEELLMAYKAMMYDKAVERQSQPQTQNKPKTSGMKPSTSAPPSKGNNVTTIREKLVKSGDIQDAMALVMAQRAQRKK